MGWPVGCVDQHDVHCSNKIIVHCGFSPWGTDSYAHREEGQWMWVESELVIAVVSDVESFRFSSAL